MSRDAIDPNRCALEKGGHEVLEPDRYSRLDELFIEHLDASRKCDGKSVRDVINALRIRYVPVLPASGDYGTVTNGPIMHM